MRLPGVTLPYLLQLANKGPERAMHENNALLMGLNTYKGYITYKAVAEVMEKDYVPVETILSAF